MTIIDIDTVTEPHRIYHFELTFMYANAHLPLLKKTNYKSDQSKQQRQDYLCAVDHTKYLPTGHESVVNAIAS